MLTLDSINMLLDGTFDFKVISVYLLLYFVVLFR